jgi:hypothetical protein
MRFKLHITPNTVKLDNQVLDETTVANIAAASTVVQRLKDGLILETNLNRKGAWRLPLQLLSKLYIVIVLTSCSGAYWETNKHTVSGRHNYYRMGWPQVTNCKTYNELPTKQMTFKRYTYWKPSK